MERTQVLAWYRTLARTVRNHGPLAAELGLLLKTRIRQDYAQRYERVTGRTLPWGSEIGPGHCLELDQRVQNTRNLLHNALVGDGGRELAVVKALVQFEQSKSINAKLRSHFNDTTEVRNLRRYRALRDIERAARMEGAPPPHFLRNGKFDPDFAFGYLSVLRKLAQSQSQAQNPAVPFHMAILHFEEALVAFNEEHALIL